MNNISVESQFLKFPTSMISDALDEIGVMGAISGVSAQRYDQGRIAGRALPVRFKKKLDITTKLQMVIIFFKRSMHDPLLNRGK